jgi:hypothetical protein
LKHSPITYALGVLLLTAVTAIAACNDEDSAKVAPPGSRENPLVAEPMPGAESAPEAAPAAAGQEPSSRGQKSGATSSAGGKAAQQAAAGEPGFEKLVEDQTAEPRERFSPCNLVSRARAQAVIGKPIDEPIEAPQGPTCIYSAEGAKTFITVAVQSLQIERIKKHIRNRREVEVANRAAYCGIYGQEVLYLPLERGRILSVTGPCDVATKLATAALPRLEL